MRGVSLMMHVKAKGHILGRMGIKWVPSGETIRLMERLDSSFRARITSFR